LQKTSLKPSKFSVTPGIRYEHITSVGQGRFGVSQGNDVAMPEETLVRNKALLDWDGI
jgi:Fe(3+) dicitrate transport protein